MGGDQGPNLLYLVLLLVLVGSSLVSMRLPIGKVLRMTLAWLGIFGAVFVLFAFRSEFAAIGQRLKAEATGAPIQAGEELRIPIARDGHFWVEARVNGEVAPFLVDSGASITTLSGETADAAGIEPGMRVATVGTANGTVRMPVATAESFTVGPINRDDLTVHINEGDELNVLGMNFLSSLSSWRVEGNYLVLAP